VVVRVVVVTVVVVTVVVVHDPQDSLQSFLYTSFVHRFPFLYSLQLAGKRSSHTSRRSRSGTADSTRTMLLLAKSFLSSSKSQVTAGAIVVVVGPTAGINNSACVKD
jgi:hypothetical protein